MNPANEPPTVFIGVPVRNGGAYLEQALDSIRKQVYSHWIAVVSDNCSGDETLAIAHRYAAMDKRFSVLAHAEPKSAKQNFGFLLAQASTEYFCWLAADDFWSPYYLSELVGALQRNPKAGLAFGPYAECHPDGQVSGSGHRLRYESLFSSRRLARFLLPPGANRDSIFYGMYRRKYINSAQVWRTHSLDAGGPTAYSVLAKVLLTSEYVFAEGRVFLWFNRIHNESHARAEPPPSGWLELRAESMLREAQAIFGRSWLPLISTVINLFVRLEGKRDFFHDVGEAVQARNLRLLFHLFRNHPPEPRSGKQEF